MNFKITDIQPNFRKGYGKDSDEYENMLERELDRDKLENVLVWYEVIENGLNVEGVIVISGDEFRDWVKSLFEKKIENWGFEKNVRENH